MSRYRAPGLGRWMKGLSNAEAKGRAAAEDGAFTEADNPYRMYEHRRSWLDGFRSARAQRMESSTDG